MSDRLPVQIDPLSLAQRGADVHGHVPVSAFRRLADWLENTDGRIEVEMRFVQDDAQRPRMQVRLQGMLALTCQRCLEAVAHPVDQAMDVVLVESEAEAGLLPETVDAVIMGPARRIHTVDLIEDELILALPLIARCPDEADCRPAVELLDSEAMLGDKDEPDGKPPVESFDDTDETH